MFDKYVLILYTLAMEIEELTVCENQIEFDFDTLEKAQEEEESSLMPQGFVVSKNYDWIDDEVLFVIVRERNELTKPFDMEICGKKMEEWVALAGSECEKLKVETTKETIFETLRDIKTDKKYMAVFYGDTPLVEKPLFHKIMDYFCRNNMNAMTLPRGYVFKTEYLKTENMILPSCAEEFDELAFLVADSARNISRISKNLYDKIRSYHLRNGVIMFGAPTIFIDADVEIEAGAVIYPNNILRGQTYIGKNVVLQENNIISDSIIEEGANITSSFIDKSKISQNVVISPYEKIINENR